ncbi:hypothetical protein KW433_22195 [Enterobacter kobei]|uniref:phage baseplate protein n=1 Tax=Enterobacter cloacae complex TaxID=354276 RepID=UPI00101096BA|nr:MULTISPECIES: hypothetical protein [Enterobacter cloacae complex]MCS4604756.1 hypothetical protein [Enterobacter kobei]RXX45691.1 hypothetical protein DD604_22710 [Enterobacter cloacae]
MADILLKYLTDLPSAADADSSDLMHINQAGNDRSITLEVLASAIFNIRYPVGKVEWFANDTNPNAIWAGSTWARVPGQGKTVRIANSSGSDVLQQGGSDTSAISISNLPPHKHDYSGKTASYDYGTKTTTSDTHNHTYQRRNGADSGDVGSGGNIYDQGPVSTNNTSSDTHNHTVAIGAHEHDYSGSTANTGSGSALDVTNAYIKLAAWYRTA